MKFALISYDLTGASIAYKMQQEGNDVIVGQIFNKEDTLLDQELKKYKKEKPDAKEKRLSLYDGMLKKTNAWKLLRFLETENSKDWYIFTDSNNSWKFMEQIKGFQGHFPTRRDRELEVSRETAKEFVKQHYKDVKVADYHSFKKIQEGISFLKKSTVIYVLKSQGDAGDTMVPKTDDLETAKEMVINQLQTKKKEYEQNGFIFEEKIEKPLELTPEMVFYDGEPIHTIVDIENKSMFSGNIGPSMGCAQNLIIKTELDAPINTIAFPPAVREIAKQRKGYFIWDTSILFDKNNVPYFGEFCSNRLGWDAFITEIAMSGDKDGNKIASPYFENILKKKNPLREKFGAAVRTFNISEGKNEADVRITWDAGADPDIYLIDARKDKEIVTAGYQWDLSVITGVGNTPEKAIEKCYEYVDMFHVADAGWRARADFLSTDYRTAIMNRYSYMIEHKWI